MQRPKTISKKSWRNLKLKERAFVVYWYERRYSQDEIMRKLFIENERSFRAFRMRVSQKIEIKV